MLLTSKQACKALNVHPNTIRRWARDGNIVCKKTAGGHNRYDIETPVPQSKQKEPKEAKNIIYCRVSSGKQKADLQRQVAYMREKYAGYEVIQDIGSGLNYKRTGFQRLLGLIMRNEVSTLAIAERDRLCRFGYDMCAFICESFNTAIVVDRETDQKSPSEEMVQDVMSIIHVFSAKMCGKRRYQSCLSSDLQEKQQRKKSRPVDGGSTGQAPPDKGESPAEFSAKQQGDDLGTTRCHPAPHTRDSVSGKGPHFPDKSRQTEAPEHHASAGCHAERMDQALSSDTEQSHLVHEEARSGVQGSGN